MTQTLSCWTLYQSLRTPPKPLTLPPHANAPTSPQEGEAFSAAADSFCRRYITRGIPSLFPALRPLYRWARAQAGVHANACRLGSAQARARAAPHSSRPHSSRCCLSRCAHPREPSPPIPHHPSKPNRSDASKVELLGQLFERYEAALRATGALPPALAAGAALAPAPAAPAANGEASDGGAPAAANGGAGLRPIELSEAQRRADEQERDQLLWVLHFLSQHRSWLGDAERALAANAEALQRGPDVVELHSARGAILAAAGDTEGGFSEGGGRRSGPRHASCGRSRLELAPRAPLLLPRTTSHPLSLAPHAIAVPYRRGALGRVCAAARPQRPLPQLPGGGGAVQVGWWRRLVA